MIKERIIQLIEFKGIAKETFYPRIGMTSASFRGKAKETPINSTAIENILSEIPDTNPLWLLTGKGSMLLDNLPSNYTTENVVNDETPVVYGKKDITIPSIVTVDKQGKDNVVLVPVKAAAGYLTGYDDPKFIEKLPTYSLPNIKNGTFRMFQVAGHSMHPTLMDKSYVVGEWVENWIKDIKDNRVYVVVCDDGVLVKRALNRLKKYGNLYLKSDNRLEHPNRSIELENICEVWEVKMHIGLELPDPSILYDRVNDLEANVMYLMNKIGK